MSDAFYVAGSGMGAQQRALDTIAANITNMNTYGYKRTEMRFVEVLAERAEQAAPAERVADQQSVVGVSIQSHAALFEQGVLEATGRPTDLAIEGAGFLEVMGPRGERLLWRGGALGVGSDGMLTAEGRTLAALIAVPLDATDLTIARDGTVAARLGTGGEEVLGRLSLVRAEGAEGIERLGGGLYRAGDAARLTNVMPEEDGGGALVQGALERSSVDMNAEMVSLMVTQRAFAANAQIVQAADRLMAIANELRR